MRMSDANQDWGRSFGGSKGPALRWLGCPPPTPGAGAAGLPKRSKIGRNDPHVPERARAVEMTLAEIFPHSPRVSNIIAAQILGLTPQHLRRWAMLQSGPIQHTKAGSRIMWAVADLQNLLDGKAPLR